MTKGITPVAEAAKKIQQDASGKSSSSIQIKEDRNSGPGYYEVTIVVDGKEGHATAQTAPRQFAFRSK